jgi:hypothetical protein
LEKIESETEEWAGTHDSWETNSLNSFAIFLDKGASQKMRWPVVSKIQIVASFLYIVNIFSITFVP